VTEQQRQLLLITEVYRMKMFVKIKKQASWTIVAALFVIVNSLVFFSCASVGTHGRLKYSSEVKQLFETYTVLPDHTYYYSGQEAQPRVVMGIHNDYVLEAKLWKKMDPTPEQLNKWINWQTTRAGFDQRTNGFYILGSDGEKIGIWYALKDWRDTTVVKMGDGNRVTVYTPIQMQGKTPKFYTTFKFK
jgi:hypothetical protein